MEQNKQLLRKIKKLENELNILKSKIEKAELKEKRHMGEISKLWEYIRKKEGLGETEKPSELK